MTRLARSILSLLVGGLLPLLASPARAEPRPVDFVRDIEPLFRARCYGCHDQRKAQGQLRLDGKAFAMKGGVSGKVIIPGDSRRSRLVTLLRSPDAEERMPPRKEPLPKAKIDLIAAWIDQGARWPDTGVAATIDPHWAYVKPGPPELPRVRNARWVRNPIDAFVLARLERDGLEPSSEASREALIRRVSLDLIGLPPTPREVDEFVADRSPNAYDRVVDRLLASPHYGERWARPWLDLARYADTDGGSFDRPRVIWRYRDWVIQALNRDMPFTRFTIEQLAGDLMPNATLGQKIATGFHRNTMTNEEEGVDREEARWETLLDRVGTTATVWLGSTIACAQCHNHKYDPFTQRQFYQLLAFFETADEVVLEVPTLGAEKKPAVSAALMAPPDSTLVLQERPSAVRPSTHLRVRGSFVRPGEKVDAATPAALHAFRDGLPANRLGLAHWLVDEENPLVARVTINRVWDAYFGRPLVETPEDFGTQGLRPIHRELLDWLATEFVRQGWGMKGIHRLIVTSATYRQSSSLTPTLIMRDPHNRLLARGPRFRMEAEMIRDVALAASGLLSMRIGGPSIFPPLPEGSGVLANNKATIAWTPSQGEDRYRRGLYVHWQRTAPYPAFTTFDAPSREVSTVRRLRTNTPLQALTALNDPAFVEAARGLARRILAEAGPDPAARAQYGFRLCVVRSPDARELGLLVAAYRRELEHFRTDLTAAHALVRGAEPLADGSLPELAAWTVVANILLNLDETLTKG